MSMRGVMGMVEFNIQKARAFVQQKQAKRSQKNHQLFEKAWQDFENIVRVLTQKYHLRRIYQWGSLLDEKQFSSISDIDIAVEGIQSVEQYFQMLEEVDQLTDFHLDLVDIERIDPIHAETIKKRGKLVYERR